MLTVPAFVSNTRYNVRTRAGAFIAPRMGLVALSGLYEQFESIHAALNSPMYDSTASGRQMHVLISPQQPRKDDYAVENSVAALDENAVPM